MKKLFLIWILFLRSIILSWCNDIKDWPGMERNVDEGGERFSVAEWYCADEWWKLEIWGEWGEEQPVCYFEEDKSFCYFEDMYDGLCHKWDLYYYYEDLYPYAEQACIDSNGQISQTEYEEDICIFSDNEFCYMDDIMDWACDLLEYNVQEVYDIHEDERKYQEYIAECYEQEQITVCGKDWIGYYNRCFMEKAWVEEDTEAEIVGWECVFW